MAWQLRLVTEVHEYIEATARGRYDGNMRAAALLGRALVVWYCSVHRAKTYDENRPLAARREAARQLARYRAQLFAATQDDELMGQVWKHQRFHPPYGRGAKGGKFK